jgi:hypothetical protein
MAVEYFVDWEYLNLNNLAYRKKFYKIVADPQTYVTSIDKGVRVVSSWAPLA